MKALSIRAPWWWMILHAGKDIENRDWATNFRGTVYVHASKWWRQHEYFDDMQSAQNCYRDAGGMPMESVTTHRYIKNLGGHIVGTVDIVDCVTNSSSPWFFGKYGFVLRNPVVFAVPWLSKGALGLFEVANREGQYRAED